MNYLLSPYFYGDNLSCYALKLPCFTYFHDKLSRIPGNFTGKLILFTKTEVAMDFSMLCVAEKKEKNLYQVAREIFQC